VNKQGKTTKLVRVKVTPGARRESFTELRPGVFEASVREKAEGNAANTRVRALLAIHFKVSAKAVRIVSGHRAKSKLVSVPVTQNGMTPVAGRSANVQRTTSIDNHKLNRALRV